METLRMLSARMTMALLAGLLACPAIALADQDFCVDDMAGLRAALAAWTSAPDAQVTIRMVQGTYAVDGAAGATLGAFQASSPASLQLLGGYSAGCAARMLDPRNTVIDGRNEMTARLRLSNVDGDVLFEGLTFTRLPDGIDVVHDGSQPASGHRLRVSHCRIVDNDTRAGSGNPTYTLRLWGVGASTSGAEVALENSLLARNYNQGFGLASVLTTGNGGRIVLTDSTIAANPVGIGTAAITLQTFSGVSGLDFVVMNDIAWHNGTPGAYLDIDVSNAPQPPAITYTLAGAIKGPIAPTTTNLDADPRFLSPNGGNFRLGPDSPALDAGSAEQPGALPDVDLDGRPRVAGSAIDLGAYEAIPGDLIFYSGMDD
jgi:hypothetical protein